MIAAIVGGLALTYLIAYSLLSINPRDDEPTE